MAVGSAADAAGRDDRETSALVSDWFDAYRKLGQAVLRNAVSDANRSGGEKDDARAFLMGGERLAFWCAVAGFNAAAVRDAAKRRWRST